MYKKIILTIVLLGVSITPLFISSEIETKEEVLPDLYSLDYGEVYNVESINDVYNVYGPPIAMIPQSMEGEGEGEEYYDTYGPSTSLAPEGIERFLITDINNPGVPLAPTNSGVSKEGEGEDDKELSEGFIFELDKENNLKISFDSPTGTRVAISIGSVLTTLGLWGGTLINLTKAVKDKFKTNYEKPYRKPKKRRKKKVDEELKEDNYNKEDRF